MAAFTNEINAGRLRHKVELFGDDGGENGAGEPTESSLGVIPAAIEPLQGAARYAASQFVERSSHDIIIRFRKGMATGLHLFHDEAICGCGTEGRRKFALQVSVDVDERHRFLHLLVMDEGLVEQ